MFVIPKRVDRITTEWKCKIQCSLQSSRHQMLLAAPCPYLPCLQSNMPACPPPSVIRPCLLCPFPLHQQNPEKRGPLLHGNVTLVCVIDWLVRRRPMKHLFCTTNEVCDGRFLPAPLCNFVISMSRTTTTSRNNLLRGSPCRASPHKTCAARPTPTESCKQGSEHAPNRENKCNK